MIPENENNLTSKFDTSVILVFLCHLWRILKLNLFEEYESSSGPKFTSFLKSFESKFERDPSHLYSIGIDHSSSFRDRWSVQFLVPNNLKFMAGQLILYLHVSDFPFPRPTFYYIDRSVSCDHAFLLLKSS